MTTTNNAQPVDRVKIGLIESAIWKNVDTDGNVRYNATIQRRYIDKDENWQSTASYGRDDLLVLAKVADLAHTRICELQSEDRESNRSEQTPPSSARKQTAKAR